MTKVKLRRRRRAQRGFNLLELMVVVTIIGMLTGIVGVAVYDSMKQARIQTANTQIRNFENALGMFQIRFSRYPRSEEGLAILLSPPGDVDGFIEDLPEDPWGQAYVYARPDPTGAKRFLVLSAGPDGARDTDDDLRN